MNGVNIPNSLKELSEAIIKRQNLVIKRDKLRLRVNSGADFFYQQLDKPDASQLASGAKLMNEVVSELRDIDNQIFELDTITVSRLEQELSDSIIKVRTSETMNDAGDVVKSEDFFCIPSCYAKEDMVTVDADDLLFLKIIKSAFALQKIEIIRKDEK